jgi:hypothetical protein
MTGLWYSCCPTAGVGDAVCVRCRRAVLATSVPPAGQILCDPCFDWCYTRDDRSVRQAARGEDEA